MEHSTGTREAGMGRGVQYARIATKRCPMHDDACAERVIAQIADRFTRPASISAEAERAAATLQALRENEAALRAVPGYDIDAAMAIFQAQIDAAQSTRDPLSHARALVEEKCGRYVRGEHKGKLRGWAVMEVVTEGGWKKDGPGQGNGRVVYPGSILSIRIEAFDGKCYLSA